MTKKTSNRFSPEVRQRAVRMVLDHGGDHASQWSAIGSIAAKIGCTAETLRSGYGRPRATRAAGGADSSRSSRTTPHLPSDAQRALQAEPGPPPPYRQAEAQGNELARVRRRPPPASNSKCLMRGVGFASA